MLPNHSAATVADALAEVQTLATIARALLQFLANDAEEAVQGVGVEDGGIVKSLALHLPSPAIVGGVEERCSAQALAAQGICPTS